jgi:hypothetical protein
MVPNLEGLSLILNSSRQEGYVSIQISHKEITTGLLDKYIPFIHLRIIKLYGILFGCETFQIHVAVIQIVCAFGC